MSALDELRELPTEHKLAGAAAGALTLTLVLPWYQKSYVPSGTQTFVQQNVSAFGVFSFVEAAVMLVAAGVLYLVWARSKRQAFHLPGGDGFVISLAGAWALLLLIWRLFDKPDAEGGAATVGLQWGIFAALLAAGRSWRPGPGCARSTGPSRRTPPPTSRRRGRSRTGCSRRGDSAVGQARTSGRPSVARKISAMPVMIAAFEE
jgi:hypothetical protein